jgi:hypothetical protein
MRLIVRTMCIALLAVAAGCSRGVTADDWQGEDYRYDFQRDCFCPLELVQPVTIEVRDGRVTRVVTRPGGEDVTHVRPQAWPTIADLVREVEEARDRGEKNLVVRYDDKLGYPTFIEIGTLANDAGVRYSAAKLEYLR